MRPGRAVFEVTPTVYRKGLVNVLGLQPTLENTTSSFHCRLVLKAHVRHPPTDLTSNTIWKKESKKAYVPLNIPHTYRFPKQLVWLIGIGWVRGHVGSNRLRSGLSLEGRRSMALWVSSYCRAPKNVIILSER